MHVLVFYFVDMDKTPTLSNIFDLSSHIKTDIRNAYSYDHATLLLIVQWHNQKKSCTFFIKLSNLPYKYTVVLLKSQDMVFRYSAITDLTFGDLYGHFVLHASQSDWCVHLPSNCLVLRIGGRIYAWYTHILIALNITVIIMSKFSLLQWVGTCGICSLLAILSGKSFFWNCILQLLLKCIEKHFISSAVLSHLLQNYQSGNWVNIYVLIF